MSIFIGVSPLCSHEVPWRSQTPRRRISSAFAKRLFVKKNPAVAGSSELPSLASILVIDVSFGTVLFVAVPLLNFTLELVALAVDDIEIIVREFAPLFLDLALGLFTVTLNTVPVHDVSSFCFRRKERTRRYRFCSAPQSAFTLICAKGAERFQMT